MNKSNQYVLKIVGCMVFVMICAIIVFTYQDFPARLMAAILGVVITATITVVLLDGQSKKEQTAKRNSKVFEEKLKIYQNFLSTLYDVVKDRKLTEEEKLQLEFQTSLVAMHCKPKSLNLVSAAVRNVISSFCPSNEKEKQKSQGNIPLLESLLSVVEALRIDLYGVDKEKDAEKNDDDLNKMLFSSEIKDKTIKNFKEAYKETADSDEICIEDCRMYGVCHDMCHHRIYLSRFSCTSDGSNTWCGNHCNHHSCLARWTIQEGADCKA